MARKYIPNLNTEEMPWLPGAERQKRLTAPWAHAGPELLQQRWFFKELRIDDQTGAVTLLFKHRAGLCFPGAGYHPTFEEAFLIEGAIKAFEDSPFVPNIYKKGYYFFRPPGWVHDSEILQETLILRMTDGHDARPSTEWQNIGRNLLLPINEAVEPRGYLRCLNSNDLPWVTAFEFVSRHGWDIDFTYVPKDRLWFKLLSKDRNTGAMTALIRMDERFILPTAGWYTVSQELYLVEGEVLIGEHALRRGGYVYRPEGFVEGPVEAAKDSVLFCRYGGTVKRNEAALKEVDRNHLGEVPAEAWEAGH